MRNAPPRRFELRGQSERRGEREEFEVRVYAAVECRLEWRSGGYKRPNVPPGDPVMIDGKRILCGLDNEAKACTNKDRVRNSSIPSRSIWQGNLQAGAG